MQEASGSSEACAPSLFGEAVNYPTTPDTMKDFPATIPVTATAMKVRSLAAGQVDRTVSAALPDGMHVSKDARIAFQKAATLFLFYLSCLAEDERSREGRKTCNSFGARHQVRTKGSRYVPFASVAWHQSYEAHTH
ncbi:hypothetical protein BCY84_01725 [Trypanosoma cruzi cruzi]|nr:hypothetical protein BCY84_01725 [Trypanosoma cruzi cruzi]